MVASTNVCLLNDGKFASVASQVSGHEPKSGLVSVVQTDMCLSSPYTLLLDCFPGFSEQDMPPGLYRPRLSLTTNSTAQ